MHRTRWAARPWRVHAGQGERLVIASNADAKRIWEAGIEEWKILTSAALVGLARESVEMASAYACEREAFGQPIGTYQGLAHPLANDIIDADGAAMQLMWVLRALADEDRRCRRTGLHPVLVGEPHSDQLRGACDPHLWRLWPDQRI